MNQKICRFFRYCERAESFLLLKVLKHGYPTDSAKVIINFFLLSRKSGGGVINITNFDFQAHLITVLFLSCNLLQYATLAPAQYKYRRKTFIRRNYEAMVDEGPTLSAL